MGASLTSKYFPNCFGHPPPCGSGSVKPTTTKNFFLKKASPMARLAGGGVERYPDGNLKYRYQWKDRHQKKGVPEWNST